LRDYLHRVRSAPLRDKELVQSLGTLCGRRNDAGALRNIEPLRLIDEASAATLERWLLIAQAVRARDGEAVDIEDSNVR
jgi:hypothetical protein